MGAAARLGQLTAAAAALPPAWVRCCLGTAPPLARFERGWGCTSMSST